MRILIVDDAIETVELIERFLKPVSSFIATSDSLEGCITACAVHEFDVAIVDLTLTDSSRDDTIGSFYKIRALQPDAAIIAISGYPDPDSLREKCMAAGADLFMPKQEMMSDFGHALYTAVASIVMRKTQSRRSPTYEANVRMLCALATQAI